MRPQKYAFVPNIPKIGQKFWKMHMPFIYQLKTFLGIYPTYCQIISLVLSVGEVILCTFAYILQKE